MKNFLSFMGLFPIPADSYRKVSDFKHLSSRAKHRKLYTKRIPLNKKEEKILKRGSDGAFGWRYYFLYYMVGITCFLFWITLGKYLGLLGMLGMALEFYYFIKMDFNFIDRLEYIREEPVKTITEVHNEHRYTGAKMSVLTVSLTICLGFIVHILPI